MRVVTRTIEKYALPNCSYAIPENKNRNSTDSLENVTADVVTFEFQINYG